MCVSSQLRRARAVAAQQARTRRRGTKPAGSRAQGTSACGAFASWHSGRLAPPRSRSRSVLALHLRRGCAGSRVVASGAELGGWPAKTVRRVPLACSSAAPPQPIRARTSAGPHQRSSPARLRNAARCWVDATREKPVLEKCPKMEPRCRNMTWLPPLEVAISAGPELLGWLRPVAKYKGKPLLASPRIPLRTALTRFAAWLNSATTSRRIAKRDEATATYAA